MLAEPINGGAADKTYIEKIPYYKRSNFISTQKFVERYGSLVDWPDSNICLLYTSHGRSQAGVCHRRPRPDRGPEPDQIFHQPL